MEEVEYLYHRNAKCGCFKRETWDLPSAHDLNGCMRYRSWIQLQKINEQQPSPHEQIQYWHRPKKHVPFKNEHALMHLRVHANEKSVVQASAAKPLV
jgi:hypothetical protein